MWRTIFTVMIAIVATAGCATERQVLPKVVLTLEGGQWAERIHVHDVDDPFILSQPPIRVMAGEPAGGVGTPTPRKMTFLCKDGFFSVPASGAPELHMTIGVVGLRKIHVYVGGRDPKGHKRYCLELPAEGCWCEVVIPLLLDRNKPGSTIEDITIFQVGEQAGAGLYLKKIVLRSASLSRVAS